MIHAENSKLRLLALCLLLGSSSPWPAASDDWPSWRGPRGTGVAFEESLPSRVGPETVAWSVGLAGAGVSSPVVWKERIVVTSQRGRGHLKPGPHPKLARTDPAVAASESALAGATDEEESVLFVVEVRHREDGRRLWEYRLPARGERLLVHEKHNLASPSPLVDAEGVYAWFGTGQLVALSWEGEARWRRHLGEENAPFEIDWGHGSSPALHGDLLFLLCYHDEISYLLAVDRRSGATRWRVDRSPEVRSYSTPVVIDGPRGEELIVNSTEGIHAYDPATGDLLWHAGGEHRFGIGVPSFHDGVLYASRGYRSGPYLALRPGGRGDVTQSHVLWQVPTGAPYVSSLVFYRGLLYMGNDHGIVTCVDAANGEKVWQQRTGGIFSASPVAGDGKVYFMSETGDTIVYRAGREPVVVSRDRLDGRIVASPAVADRRIYVRTDDRLFAIGPPRAGGSAG